MIWKRTLPCVSLACLAATGLVVLFILSLAGVLPDTTNVQGILFLVWLAATGLVAFAANADLRNP